MPGFLEGTPAGKRLRFLADVALLKKLGAVQLKIDKDFAAEFFGLKREMYRKKIKPTDFWTEYKKMLVKSVGRDTKIVKELIKRVDKKVSEQFKEAEKREKERKEKEPPLDLSLPG